MEIITGVLAFLVAVLAVLQGWQMRRKRNSNSVNPNLGNISSKLDNISSQLGIISSKLGKMEQRLDDVWDKVKK